MNRLLSLLFLLLLPTTASAQERARRPDGEPSDLWSEPNPGVRYLHRTLVEPTAVSIRALVVELDRPGVRIVATPEEARWGTVSDFARSENAVAAVNGGFWSVWQRPTGVTAGGGALWDGGEPDPEFGHFGITRDGRAVVRAPGEGEDERSLARLSEAVSGRPLLVADGEVALESLDTFPGSNQRQPRTAAGVSRDGKTVILVVVDGRQSHSRGLTLYQLARVLVELGADRGINLDGGGSSAMYVERAGGIVSSPSRGRWVRALGMDETATQRVRTAGGQREVFERGVEREVMNHLAVIAPPPANEVAVGEHASDGLDPIETATTSPVAAAATFVPASSAPIRVGRMRELLYPTLGIAFPLGVVVAPVWIWRRRARRSIAHRAT